MIKSEVLVFMEQKFMSESLELIDEPNFNLFDVIERIEQSDSSEEVILQENDSLLQTMNITELRDCVRLINRKLSGVNKGSPRHYQYMMLKYKIVENERSRPIEEQFPFLLNDLDKMTEDLRETRISLEKTAESLKYIESNQKNVANEIENSLGELFKKWLERNQYEDIANVSLEGGRIYVKKGLELVQWDNVIGATLGTKEYIFFMECKDIGHANHLIFQPPEKKTKRLDMSEKIERTYDYLTRKVHLIDENKIWRGLRSQINELKQYENACIVFVFACASVISEEVKERTEKLKELHDASYEEHLNIWLISCLRGSNLNIDWQS